MAVVYSKLVTSLCTYKCFSQDLVTEIGVFCCLHIGKKKKILYNLNPTTPLYNLNPNH